MKLIFNINVHPLEQKWSENNVMYHISIKREVEGNSEFSWWKTW